MNFPVHVYKSPGKFRYKNGKTYRYVSVANEDQLNRAIADGWNLNKEDAVKGKPQELPDEVIDNAPPTRDEMEAKARELGLKFDGRTSDRKLMAMISDALGERDGVD